ncbi:MAG: acyltransferase family protein [Clostridia bacterium]|nr:acyltransferase family protein [Clostridia bacterium]
MSETKKRDLTVDALRGMAMLMVVLGHTITGTVSDSQDSFLYQVIWSLQMPLFILISGYCTRFSSELTEPSQLGRLLGRRTLSYLLPWVVWTFGIKGLLLGKTRLLDLKWTLWHMDSGYWFLFTLWTISVIFAVARYMGAVLGKGRPVRSMAVKVFVYLLGMGCVAGVGLMFGMSFLGTKLTLYYMPFFFAGHLWGVLQDRILANKNGRLIVDIAAALLAFVWLAILLRMDLYTAEDFGLSAVIRAIASLSGCAAVSFVAVKSGPLFQKFFGWIGVHSLAIYVSHYMFLIKTFGEASIKTLGGVTLVAVNFVIAASLAALTAALIDRSRTLKLILLGQRK